mgnify:CR=1 FL=1
MLGQALVFLGVRVEGAGYLRLAIVVWIERKYHRQRAQDALGGLTPIEFETIMTTAVELAA